MSDLTPGDVGTASLATVERAQVRDALFQRLRDLLVSPARLMDNVGVRPQWWVPGVMIVVAITAASWFTLPISEPERIEMMRDSKIMRLMPEEQYQEQYNAALNLAPDKRLILSLAAGVVSWAIVLGFGFILGFFVRMSGGKGTFRQALGITSWAALVSNVLGPIIATPLVLLTESAANVSLGLAAIVQGLDPNSVFLAALKYYGDVLTWWFLAILVIGFSRVFGLSTKVATTSVVLPWAVLGLVPLGLHLLTM